MESDCILCGNTRQLYKTSLRQDITVLETLKHSFSGPPIPEGTCQGPRAVSRIRIQEVPRIEER